MQKIIILLVASLAFATARPGGPPNPLPKPEDRQAETKWKIEDPGILKLQHREKIFEDREHRLDGTAVLKKDLLNNLNPTQIGGRVDYNYKPARTSVGLEALNSGRYGTDVAVQATRNIFKDRNSALDLGVKYGQHFGGPGGRSEPFVGGFITGHW